MINWKLGYISPSFAILFGVIPVIATYLSMKLKSKLTNLDDSLDVFYCHGVGGISLHFLFHVHLIFSLLLPPIFQLVFLSLSFSSFSINKK